MAQIRKNTRKKVVFYDTIGTPIYLDLNSKREITMWNRTEWDNLLCSREEMSQYRRNLSQFAL